MKSLVALLIVSLTCLSAGQKLRPEPLQISIGTFSPVIQKGEKLMIEISVKNISADDVDCSMLIVNGVDRGFEFSLKDRFGNMIPQKAKTTADLAFENRPCILPAGRTQESRAFVDKVYALQTPGEYTLTLSRRIQVDGQILMLNSNPLTITVTAKP